MSNPSTTRLLPSTPLDVPADSVRASPAEACTIIVFGAAGDLARRKLLPALRNLDALGLLGSATTVVGVVREDADAVSFDADEHDKPSIAFAHRVQRVVGDLADPALYARLAGIAAPGGAPRNVLFYLALPPRLFGDVVERLGAAGMLREAVGAWRRVIVEKPFGSDLASAQLLSARLESVAAERQIFRIDHYLGKETVQNILVFRFANGLFEPLWDRRYVDHVEISVAESEGVGHRGAFYDATGALRDVVQNHMLQILALIAMEPPNALTGESVRSEKMKVLEAVRPLSADDVGSRAVRGQYGPGAISGAPVEGYRFETDVPHDSSTETFAAVRLEIDNWRWAGVPFYLRTGKRLKAHDTRVVVALRRPPVRLFPPVVAGALDANHIVMQLQPDEGIRVHIKAKVPGLPLRLTTVDLAFSYGQFGDLPPTTGYEQLLYDAMNGDTTLFHRADMVEAAWRVVTPVLDVWAATPPSEFPNYAPGTWGPDAAQAMLARDGRAWCPSHGGAAAGKDGDAVASEQLCAQYAIRGGSDAG